MGILGQLGQSAANTTFLTKASEVFANGGAGLWQEFADVVPMQGRALSLGTLGPNPKVRELVGSRRFGSLRANAAVLEAREYSTDALEIPRLDVERDQSGLLTKRLTDYINSNANYWDEPVTEKLLTNPVGMDKVALISSSHPYGADSATWSNNAGSVALNATTFDAGIAAMSSQRMENGRASGFYPTHLMVGPALRKMAMDLTLSAYRAVGINNLGAPASSGVVAAVAMPNWIGGTITPFINPNFVGAYANAWLLMDLSRPGIKPMIVGVAMAPRGVVVDDPQSEPMAMRANYQYYVDGAAAIGGYAPWTVYGTFVGARF